MDVSDVLVPPDLRVDDAQRLESVVNVRYGCPSTLEKSARSNESSPVSVQLRTDAPGRDVDSRCVKVLIGERERRDEGTCPKEDYNLLKKVF